MKRPLMPLLALFASGLCVSAQSLSGYQATVNSQRPAFYFTFDAGNVTDTVGQSVALASNPNPFTQLVSDAWGNPGNAAQFLAKGDVLTANSQGIINGGGVATNTDATQATSGAITFLFRAPDPGTNNPGYLCIFSGGNVTSNHNALALLVENNKALTTNSSFPNGTNNWPDSLKLRFGSGSQVILPQASIVPNAWYYFALSYTESTNSYGAVVDSTGTNVIGKAKWFLGRPGGALLSGLTTNALDSMAGDGSDFYVGNELDTTHGYVSGLIDEFATWSRQLSDSEIQAQFANLPNLTPPPRITYQSLITSQAPTYFFRMDGNFVDAVSGTLTLKTNGTTTALTYDYFGGATNAATFVTGGDALTNNGNLLNGGGTYTGSPGAGQGAVSCLFRTLNSYVNQGNRFLYDAGGNPATSNRFSLFFNTYSSVTDPEALRLGFGDSATTILTTNNFLPATWYYFAMTYDESLTNKQVKWWLGPIGGALTSGSMSPTNGSLAGQGNVFVIGSSSAGLVANSFRNSTPSGQGRIDEFAIWNRVLSTNEVKAQFNQLVLLQQPALGLATSGTNALLTWPSRTDPGFSLQSTANLAAPSWSSAGSPAVVGAQYVVTNGLGSSGRFYRLQK